MNEEDKPELLHWFDKAIDAAHSMFHGAGTDDIAAQREIAESRAAIASIASNIACLPDATGAADDDAKALREVIERTAEVIERQLALIADRAPGNYLDKRPVVQSMTLHAKRLRAALKGD